jgi:hypothetical protein
MQQPYRLGSLLVRKRFISQSQLDSALIHQHTSGLQLGESLVDLNILTQKQINSALRKQSRIRLYAACITFLMAPVSWCQASSEIESLPEYSYTQVADQHINHNDYNDYSVKPCAAGLNLMSVATGVAWYMYQGGMEGNQFKDVPVKVNLAAAKNNAYSVQISVSF